MEDKEPVDTNQEAPTQRSPTLADPLKSYKQPLRSRRRKLIVGILIVVAICFFAGIGGSRLYQLYSTSNNRVTSRDSTKNDGNNVVTKQEQDIASIVSKVSPSVVSVVTQSQSASYQGTVQQDGAGSGIIISKDGYILTNKHVVNGADTVDVVLSDGTSYDNVKVIGVDPLNDIAFMKIPNVDNLPVAELGNSSSIRVGQQVVAIGNSLGQYQNTVTSGIISGTGRPISAQDGNGVENLTDLLQTDAAINPGNSGGPLLNLQGQVIGINTAIVKDAQGIGFAIPINATKGLLKGVLAGGSVERAYIGINYTSITAEVAKQYNLPVKKGAYVHSGSSKSAVIVGSPAAKAGIQEKDIVTKVNSVETGTQGGLSSLVSEYAPGETIELTVLRNNQEVAVKVTLAVYKG